MSTASPRRVEIHLDPCCPWAWLTSRWLVEAAATRPIEIVPRLFSLAEQNRATDDDRRRASHAAGEQALLALAAARRAGGDAALMRLYTEIGEAYHERSEPLADVAVLRRCAERAGVDPDAVEAALDDPAARAELDEEHGRAHDAGVFGVPSLSVDGSPPTFGPIVDRRLDREEAAALWDAVAGLLAQPHFFELKRSRTGRAMVGRHLNAAAAR